MKTKNSWVIAIAASMFTAGIIVGRITLPVSDDRESTNEGLAASEQSLTGTSHGAEGVLSPRSSVPVGVTALGTSLFDAVPVGDFERMARTAAASSSAVDNQSLLRVLISEWAKKDPLSAVMYAQEVNRTDLVYESLHQMAQQNPDEAFSWIERNKSVDGDSRYLTMAVFQGIAQADPVDAVARVEQMPIGSQRDELLSITVNQWAQQDVYAAFDWLETAEMTPQFPYLYNQMMGSYIEQDPFQAAALISDMEPCENKRNFVSQVACKIAERDVDYALEWVQALDGEDKTYALQGVMDRWSSTNATAALGYIMNHQEAPDYQSLFTTVAMNMAHKDPEALAGAFETMDEWGQITAGEQLAAAYSLNDPNRGIEWLKSLKPGAIQDAALGKALETYKNSNVPLAFTLSETISSESLRKEQIRQVMSVWVPVDQLAAEQALQASAALSSTEKEALLNEVYSSLKLNDYLLPAKL
ncbi:MULTISPECIES: hypothetical protein [unclassified Lentimonas]|uniref:hypothetical protein n=1 Tax=unclassified Lentimonas TaxID=2630993 RepID=UPI001327C266|nr:MULTISPECIES: hypothetical protein [unclassified Lentimonas]CAA6679386.1 Unannotated [Lentimonas sp. CC4]CAA6687420.1 Unannotated [Lentimonas sp. CC6]CAA7078002.1 Unannotated [Lentimonas sp. CC4]CAA7172054.1 Unannotated [Lentimonas sp. CC21]CAA7183589.1 Unannotated [Lentimonas sp. CC8]